MLQKIKTHLTQKFTEKQLNAIAIISGIILGLVAAILCQFIGVWLSEVFFLK